MAPERLRRGGHFPRGGQSRQDELSAVRDQCRLPRAHRRGQRLRRALLGERAQAVHSRAARLHSVQRAVRKLACRYQV